MRLLCRLGFHKWEPEPSLKDEVKGTGVHFAFWSEGYQKGKRKCLHCEANQKCYRSGWCGSGGSGTKWKKMPERIERYIDSLPGVFQS